MRVPCIIYVCRSLRLNVVPIACVQVTSQAAAHDGHGHGNFPSAGRETRSLSRWQLSSPGASGKSGKSQTSPYLTMPHHASLRMVATSHGIIKCHKIFEDFFCNVWSPACVGIRCHGSALGRARAHETTGDLNGASLCTGANAAIATLGVKEKRFCVERIHLCMCIFYNLL